MHVDGGQTDAIAHHLLAGNHRTVDHSGRLRQRRNQLREIRPDDAIENIVDQKLHHLFCGKHRQRAGVLAEAVMDQVRQIADVIGVRVRDEDRLDAGLLRER